MFLNQNTDVVSYSLNCIKNFTKKQSIYMQSAHKFDVTENIIFGALPTTHHSRLGPIRFLDTMKEIGYNYKWTEKVTNA
jgi:methionine synthase II (cobalamin-independent)